MLRKACGAIFISCLLAADVLSAAVPRFDVNLNLPAAERWANVTLYWADAIGEMGPKMDEFMAGKFNATTQAEWLEYAIGSLSAEHQAEMQGILDTLHGAGKTEVTQLQLYMTNFMYELESPAFCAGLLAAMPNGTVIHGRNMDYGFHFELNGEILNWPDVTYDVTFWKDEQPLMTSVQWPAQIGIHTAMRFGGWSFEQNTRRSNELWANFDAMKVGAKQFTTTMRTIMEAAPNFEDALAAIDATDFQAPQYFVMSGAGPYEAAVVTVARPGQTEPATPPVQRMNEDGGIWHLVQTNDDFDKPAGDPRRWGANLLLEPLQNDVVDFAFVEKFMSNAPLFTGSTVFTWIASPATGYHLTKARDEVEALEMSAVVEHRTDSHGAPLPEWLLHRQHLARSMPLKLRQKRSTSVMSLHE